MISDLIGWLQSFDPFWLEIALILFAYSMVVLVYRNFGLPGLYSFFTLAIVIANIQVLKAVKFPIFPDPVALGTVMFSCTYLMSDIVTEMHGRKEATKLVFSGFVMYLIWTVIMVITVGYSPLNISVVGEDWAWANDYHNNMANLFTPAPAILISGLLAYAISETLDIYLYSKLRNSKFGKYIWIRNNLSTYISTFIDNTIFSVLAWIVLAENPNPFWVVFNTYILGTWFFRIFIATMDTPFVYLAIGGKRKT